MKAVNLEPVTPSKISSVVDCENISFSYPNSHPILRKVSLSIGKGESVVIFGESGSGKSTLLRCISGYNKPLSGRITIDNSSSIDLRKKSPQSVSLSHENGNYAYQMADIWGKIQSQNSKMASSWSPLFKKPKMNQGYMVFADCFNALPQLTCEENIHLVLSPICQDINLRKRAASLLLQLTGLVNLSSQKPSALSSGQLRRLCLAQGLATNPGFLILDEPTNGLDFSTKSSFLYFIEELRQIVGFTILCVTHDLEAALFLADRILLFEDGKILDEVHVDQAHPRSVEIVENKEFIDIRNLLIKFLKR